MLCGLQVANFLSRNQNRHITNLGFLSNELTAQTTTSGGLTGVVTDPSHAVVSNADVEIRDTVKGTTQSKKTA